MYPIASPFFDATLLTAQADGAARIAVPAGPGDLLLVYNPSGQDCRLKIGGGSVAATSASFRIGPGDMQPVAIGSATHIAAWCSSGTVAVEIWRVGGL